MAPEPFHQENSVPPLEEDLVDLTESPDAFEEQNIKAAGNAVIISPQAIRIERIPFSTYTKVRGYFQ